MLLVKRLVRLKILVVSDDNLRRYRVVKSVRKRLREDEDVPENLNYHPNCARGREPTSVELSLDLQVESGRLFRKSGNRS
jgi:hypothetical protein